VSTELPAPRVTPAEAKVLQATAGADGRASAKLKAIGAGIPMPPMPLVTPVVVQLRGENGVCLGASYSSTSRNDERQFRASAD